MTMRDNKLEGDGNTLRGYAVLYNTDSRTIYEGGRVFTEQIQRGAFDRSLSAADHDIKLYFNHDRHVPLARTRNGSLRLFEDSTGIRFEADLPNTTLGNDMKELLRVGTLSGEMSFGFSPTKESWSPDKKRHTVLEGRLSEVSIVTDAAYAGTSSELRSTVAVEITQLRISLSKRTLQ